ncbi:MAG: guanylate kinase [Verrucomicrobiota bacterium]|nr:guanylate kinase [Verrucomicrobiota bacterium]
MEGTVIVISGPAGVGKTTLCEKLLKEFPNSITQVVTATTRHPREGETNGEDYLFLTKEDFQEKIRRGDFVEYEKIHENLYGTLLESVNLALKKSKVILFNVDVRGANSLKKFFLPKESTMLKFHSVFVMPKSLLELEKRLMLRNSDSHKDIQIRLETAKNEIAHANSFDQQILSEDKKTDYQAIRKIFLSFGLT